MAKWWLEGRGHKIIWGGPHLSTPYLSFQAILIHFFYFCSISACVKIVIFTSLGLLGVAGLAERPIIFNFDIINYHPKEYSL